MFDWIFKKEIIKVEEESIKVSKILANRLPIEDQSLFIEGVIQNLIILRKSEIEDLEQKLSTAQESLTNLKSFL